MDKFLKWVDIVACAVIPPCIIAAYYFFVWAMLHV